MAVVENHEPGLGRTEEIPRGGTAVSTRKARTSVAAVFSLMVGLVALLAVLTLVLTPVAIVLAVVGLFLAVIGSRNTRRVDVTGRGVAVFGAVLSLLALALSVLVIIGVTTFLNDDAAVDRLETRVQQLRDDLPQTVDIPRP
jgi:uncharacterized membrane protein